MLLCSTAARRKKKGRIGSLLCECAGLVINSFWDDAWRSAARDEACNPVCLPGVRVWRRDLLHAERDQQSPAPDQHWWGATCSERALRLDLWRWGCLRASPGTVQVVEDGNSDAVNSLLKQRKCSWHMWPTGGPWTGLGWRTSPSTTLPPLSWRYLTS